ncbi:MAG: hypothetical protein PGN34_13220 [Methylobacterium frigidaeris]
MLVYGDVTREEAVGAGLERLDTALRDLTGRTPGLDRHAALVGAFLDAAGLAQGLADAACEAAGGREVADPAQDAALALVSALARAVWASWRSGFAAVPAPDPGLLAGLARTRLPSTVAVRLPEGHAFYAVYPEGYAAAALASGLPASTRVVGLRSIGVSLGAMVAAGLGARPPLTVRPTGHPFARHLNLSPAIRERMLAPADGYAVADEGPGLSGSSFGTVADVLEDRGVAPDRVAFFPSHGGMPGTRASERHRARWSRAARHWIGFDELILDAALPAHRLDRWAADLLGPLDGPLDDLSGGAWRRHRVAGAAWPATCAWQERRKFRLAAGGRTWLLKFAGIGREGERKLARARALAEAGFTPKVAGFLHGFLAEAWHGEARPLDPARIGPDALAARVGHYLGFRTRSFPAAGQGASLDRLVEMARHNAGAALGAGAARWFDRWTAADLRRLSAVARPVETDNRMQVWEWLLLPDGTILKTDAVDHHAAHDLVGCQDIAWDVAGAEIELGLPPARVGAHLARAAGRPHDPALLDLLRPCYLAFHLGAAAMAADGAEPAEAQRLTDAANCYAARLTALAEGR